MSEHRLPPLPVPDDLTAPFWEAARDRRLVIQRCRRSLRYVHPPVPICPCCAATDLAFEEVSGRGTVYTYSVMRDRRVHGFEDRVPYVAVWVRLEEQEDLFVCGNLVEADVSDAAFDLPVEVTFERLTEDITLPQFRPRRSG